jgi:hypothetical protein
VSAWSDSGDSVASEDPGPGLVSAWWTDSSESSSITGPATRDDYGPEAGRERWPHGPAPEDAIRPAAGDAPAAAPVVELVLREPHGLPQQRAAYEGRLNLLNQQLRTKQAEGLPGALTHVVPLAEQVAGSFTDLAGRLESSKLRLVAAPGDSVAAFLIANQVSHNLNRTVILAVEGELEVDICPH